jgi:hypothetical protein
MQLIFCLMACAPSWWIEPESAVFITQAAAISDTGIMKLTSSDTLEIGIDSIHHIHSGGQVVLVTQVHSAEEPSVQLHLGGERSTMETFNFESPWIFTLPFTFHGEGEAEFSIGLGNLEGYQSSQPEVIQVKASDGGREARVLDTVVMQDCGAVRWESEIRSQTVPSAQVRIVHHDGHRQSLYMDIEPIGEDIWLATAERSALPPGMLTTWIHTQAEGWHWSSEPMPLEVTLE